MEKYIADNLGWFFAIFGAVLSLMLSMTIKAFCKYKKYKKNDKIVQYWNNNFENMNQETDQASNWSLGPLHIRVVNWSEITDSNDKGWSNNDVSFRIVEKSKSLLEEKKLNKHIEEIWNREKFLNKNLDNKKRRCGLFNFIENSTNDGIDTKILEFYKTDYKRFIGTNKNLSDLRKSSYGDKYFNPEVFLKNGFTCLSKSFLSNDLATATTVITNDNKIIFKKRTKEVYVLPNKIHTSIAEGMLWEEDQKDNCPNPFNTVVRGAKDELGIAICPEWITILAFGVYLDFAQPFIACNVNLEISYDDLKKISTFRKDEWEDKIFVLDFSVESVSPYLFESHEIQMAELGKISVILSLIKKYNRKTIEKWLYEYKSLLVKKDAAIKKIPIL